MTRIALGLTAGALVVVTACGCRFAPGAEGLFAEAENLRLRYNKSATQEAIVKYQEAQSAWRKTDKRAAARAAQGLGIAFEQLGSLDESLRAYREALVLATESGDRLLESELHSDVGIAQALAAERSELLDEAERQCRTALDMARRMGGLRQEARALNCLGDVMYGRGGKLESALENYRQAAAVWTGLGDQRGLAQATLAQGWVQSDMRQFEQAGRCFEEAKSRWTSLGDKRQLAITLVADARLLQRRGDYQDALEGFDNAMALLEPMGDAVWQAASLTGKGRIYLNMADVAQAIDFWERALALFEASGLKTFSVDVLMSVGSTLLASGDDLGALARFERALALATELGNLRWQAWAQRNIGSVYLFRLEPVMAQLHLDKSLELLLPLEERRLNALVLADMGEAQQLLSHPDLALRYFDQALAVSLAAGDREEAARGLFARGALEERQGKFGPARTSLIRALSERERLFGLAHPLVAETRAALAGVDFAGGASRTALTAALGAEETSREHLRQTLRYLPERQALTFAEKRPRGLDLAISIVASGAALSAASVLDGVIQSRGLVLDELAARKRSIDMSDSQVAALNVMVTQARQRFANLLVRSLQESVARPLLDEARQKKEEAERELAEHSAETRAEIARSPAGFEAVRSALPPGSALVSFVQYARSLRPVTVSFAPSAAPAPSFAAFIVRSGHRDVPLVPLGSVAEIERLVTAWRAEAAGTTLLAGASAAQADVLYRATGSRLRGAIWDPLANHLRGVNRVFVVPDGVLGLVPFAALPIGRSAYLLDRAPPLQYLSAERDLVSVPVASSAKARGMLALGGPAFGEPGLPGPIAGSAKRAVGTACGSFQELSFQPLDGTLQEVQELSSVWNGPASDGAEAAHVLVGPQANETTFKREAHRYRVLHLATHGFFLGRGCSASGIGTRGVGGLAASGALDNPLLLSGLALAGANRRASTSADEDDGILTAEEVASLDLEGVEWAVLSACDTGIGEIKAGESVFGLRRAFQVAGARTVVMSLWSVDDQATRAWMRALYEGRFQRKLSTADAVHEASLAVLRARRAKGQSTHPFYWAGFVAAGDWR